MILTLIGGTVVFLGLGTILCGVVTAIVALFEFNYYRHKFKSKQPYTSFVFKVLSNQKLKGVFYIIWFPISIAYVCWLISLGLFN